MNFKYAVYLKGNEHEPDELLEEFDTFKKAKEEAIKQAKFGLGRKIFVIKYQEVFEI